MRRWAGLKAGIVGGPLVAAALATGATPSPTPPATAAAAVLAAAELRVGIERLAKLCVERAALAGAARTRDEIGRERQRVAGALEALRSDPALSARRRGQVMRVADGVTALVERIDASPAGAAWTEVYRDSEALAAQMSFVSTGLSGEMADGERATLVDLLTRAAATALRVGKLNFAAAAGGPTSRTIEVDLRQALGEFSAALQAISAQSLPDRRMRDELELARNQWVLFSAALNAGGLVKDRKRLPDVATTADRIAQSLLAMAQKALRTPAEPAARRG